MKLASDSMYELSYLGIWIRVTSPSKPPESHGEEVEILFSSLSSKTSCNEERCHGKLKIYFFFIFCSASAHLDRIVTVTDDDTELRELSLCNVSILSSQCSNLINGSNNNLFNYQITIFKLTREPSTNSMSRAHH